MKLSITILLFITLFHFKSWCQSCIVGEQGFYYHNITPDTLLDPTIGSANHTPPDQYYEFDINQDGINDLKITAHAYLSMSYASSYISVTCLNAEVSLAYGNTDSTFNNYLGFWTVRNILKRYNLYDTIAATNFTAVPSCYLAFYTGQTGSYATSSEWVNIGDRFFGVRYISQQDTSYGYVRVNLGGFNNCDIKEFNLSAPFPISIHNDYAIDRLFIYPNPANSILNIEFINELKEVNQFVLLDMYGAQYTLSMIEKNKIDVSQLNEGIYFLKVELRDKIVLKKILILH